MLKFRDSTEFVTYTNLEGEKIQTAIHPLPQKIREEHQKLNQKILSAVELVIGKRKTGKKARAKT